jgi:hypothetical protein
METKQAPMRPHPMHKYGYTSPPFWAWRVHPTLYAFIGAAKDIWLIARGKCTLHRAFQCGYDQHIMDERARRARGGQ